MRPALHTLAGHVCSRVVLFILLLANLTLYTLRIRPRVRASCVYGGVKICKAVYDLSRQGQGSLVGYFVLHSARFNLKESERAARAAGARPRALQSQLAKCG